jgi:hypothetical protein
MVVAGGTNGDKKCVQDFVGEPEEKRLLGKRGRRWEDNIKMDKIIK